MTPCDIPESTNRTLNCERGIIVQEIIKNLLELVGGISVVVCVTLGLCKGVFEKYIYTQIEKSAEKELERVKNTFSKSFTAYEILLKKEFEYYESIDKIYAEVIVDVQDVGFYSIEDHDIKREIKCENIKEISLRLLQAIKNLKNLNLLYQVYVPVEIFSVTGQVVSTMQDNCKLIEKTAVNVFEGKDCDEVKIKEFIKGILSAIALSNALIRNRLDTLSQ